MTLGQIEIQLRAIEREHSERLQGVAYAMRMAQADGKAWRDYMRGLARGGGS